MYDLYKEITVNPVSYRYYSAEFQKLKLTFKKPIIDTYHKCDILKIKMDAVGNNEEKNKIIKEKEEHLLAAEIPKKKKRRIKLEPQI